MVSLWGTLLISVLVSLIIYLYNLYTYWSRHGVPQETPLPLLGNMKGIGKSVHFRDIHGRLYKRFKGRSPFVGAYLFLSKVAVITDLELVKHVLIKDFSNFHDRGIFNNVRDDPLTGHLLTLEGEQWRALRTKLTPVFTSARMKYMFPTVVKVGENLAEVVGEMVKEANDNGSVLEMKELCARYTTDVIGTCAFGLDCCSLRDPNAEFRLKGKSIFTDRRHPVLVQQFIITNPELGRKLRMKFFPDQVTNFFLNVVRDTVDYRLRNNIKRNDFLDLLIELKAKDEDMAKSNLGIDLSQGLTIEQMAAQTFVFFLAGFETSSTTMAYCLYELARHPEVQEKLRQEIEENLKQHQNEVTYEGIHGMEYLDQVVAETLRFYPVLPQLVRKAKNDYNVPNSSLVIEKGTSVLIPVYSIHHDPEYYENPEEFKPERFVQSECEKRHSCAYLPFGDGPRNCIGLRFGKMQTKVGLVALLRRYRFECCPQTEVVMDKKNLLMVTENGIKFKVVPL